MLKGRRNFLVVLNRSALQKVYFALYDAFMQPPRFCVFNKFLNSNFSGPTPQGNYRPPGPPGHQGYPSNGPGYPGYPNQGPQHPPGQVG